MQIMLTLARISALAAGSRRYRVQDGHGLSLEVHPTGRKTWRYRYQLDGRGQVMTLGRWPRVSVKAARAERDRLELEIESGENPAELARLARISVDGRQTLKEFCRRYLAEVADKTRKDSRPVLRLLEREIYPALGNVPIGSITGMDVQKLVFAKRDRGRPAAAAAMRNVLKRVLDYAVTCGVCKTNCALNTPLKFVTQAKARSRVLTASELRRFLEVLETSRMRSSHKAALKLLLLTLARKSELRLARWEDVDLGRGIWEIPAEHSKTGVPHVVYLSPWASSLFAGMEKGKSREGLVFKGHNSSTQPMSASTLNRAIYKQKWGIPHFTVHDLRRTASTMLHEQGYPADVIEKALNHAIKGIRGVYNRAQYAEQRRQMLEAWALFVAELASAQGASAAA